MTNFLKTRKRAFTCLSQIPKWHLFRFVINMQKGVPGDVYKAITHKWVSCTSPWNSRKLTLQILLVTDRKYSWSILEAKAKNLSTFTEKDEVGHGREVGPKESILKVPKKITQLLKGSTLMSFPPTATADMAHYLRTFMLTLLGATINSTQYITSDVTYLQTYWRILFRGNSSNRSLM